MDKVQFRRHILVSFGAGPAEIEQLMLYNENIFDLRQQSEINLPLMDEDFVFSWSRYKKEAESNQIYDVLKHKLVQLRFPVQTGISQTEAYRSATLKGVILDEQIEPTGLILKRPEDLELHLHQTPAGTIPVIISYCREDFVLLLQALIGKNEPIHIPTSMGACMVAGYNNWNRIQTYREQWESSMNGFGSEANWKEEFKKLIQNKALYQDRFIILNGDRPYSAVPAQELGMTEAEWNQKSLIIRREHESTHYLTRRILSSMRNHMMDELIADYAGIVAANGVFRADWFLRFIGLEKFPVYREGARLQNYLGKPKMSDTSFIILQRLLVAAAKNVENIDKVRQKNNKTTEQVIIGLCSLVLEEVASDQAAERLESALKRVVPWVKI